MKSEDLNVGMYFRTQAGTINKIDSFTEDKSEFYFDTKPIFSDGECLGSKWGYTKDIIKASENIIDLIEVGDYVNGCKVVEILKETIIIENYGEEELFNEKIKSIVTKEMFEQMSYKVGSD